MKYIFMIIVSYFSIVIFAKEKQFAPPKERLVILNKSIKEKTVPKKFSIIIWNIFKATKKNWEKNFYNITKDYDFILLQESFTIPKFNKEISRFKESNIVHAIAFSHTHTGADSGVMTISKAMPIQNEVVISQKNEPIINSPKATLVQLYKIATGQKLLLINIHAINFVKREYLFSQLNKLGEIISKHQGPVIIAGDFNTWKRGMIKFLNQFAERYNLKEARFSKDIRKKFRGFPLDHFLSRGMSIEKAEVLKDGNSSDHLPLSIKVKIND